MIKSITLRDFRGIQKGQLDDLRQINVFVGPNNSGKSALMEAVYLACTAGREGNMAVKYKKQPNQTTLDQSYPIQLAVSDMVGNHPLVKIWKRHNYPLQQDGLGRWVELPRIIEVNLTDKALPFSLVELSADKRGFEAGEETTTALFSLEPAALEERKELEEQNRPDPRPLFAQTLLGSEVEPFEQARLLFCWHPELTYYYKGSAAWLVRGVPAAPHHTLLFDAASVQGFIPLPFYERMFNTIPGWGQRIGRHFAHIFNYDKSFAVQFLPTGSGRQQMQGWLAPEDRQALSIDAFGDGAQAAFKLLTYLTAMAATATEEEPGLLLWEEPESFQNPQTLARLLQEVIHIIENKPIQLFIASHSLDVIAHLTQMLRSEELDPHSALVFRFNLQEGELKSSWFDSETLQIWLNEGFDMRIWDSFTSPLKFEWQGSIS